MLKFLISVHSTYGLLCGTGVGGVLHFNWPTSLWQCAFLYDKNYIFQFHWNDEQENIVLTQNSDEHSHSPHIDFFPHNKNYEHHMKGSENKF